MAPSSSTSDKQGLVKGGRCLVSMVIGRTLVSSLLARGHQVSATTTDIAKLSFLHELGAVGRVMDGLDPLSVGEVVATAQPDVIVNQMTGLSETHARKPNLRLERRCWRWSGTAQVRTRLTTTI